MSGVMSFTIAIVCDLESYPQVVNNLGDANIEVCYVHSAGIKRNGMPNNNYVHVIDCLLPVTAAAWEFVQTTCHAYV